MPAGIGRCGFFACRGLTGDWTPAELAAYVAECRMLRALALKSGLDPDTAAPEDIMLLNTDKAGDLLVGAEYSDALKRLEFEDQNRA